MTIQRSSGQRCDKSTPLRAFNINTKPNTSDINKKMTTFLKLNVNNGLCIKDPLDGVSNKISLSSAGFASEVESTIKGHLYVGSSTTKTLMVNPDHNDDGSL